MSKIEVKTMTPEDKITFYTALYRTNLSLVLYKDVDDQYHGLDRNIHTSRVSINGNLIKGTAITHDDIMNGGDLVFEIRLKPKKN